MHTLLLEKIEAYDRIIIHRHTRPDLDAIGSQVGLKAVIEENYPNKEVYTVGDASKFDFQNDMQDIDDALFEGALCIILDVAVAHLVSDSRYSMAKEVLVIDHHQNACTIEGNVSVIVDTTYSAAAELVADLALQANWVINEKAATFLYGGMLTDTGRFLYMTTPGRVLKIAGEMAARGANIAILHDLLYVETLANRQLKNYIQSGFNITENGVAYMKNDASLFEKFDVDVFTVSRGMVNLMAGIEEVKIWLNFTEDKENNKILGEFRARGISIVDIAKNYGGGGHAQACGASLPDWETVDKVIQDFDNRAKEIQQ